MPNKFSIRTFKHLEPFVPMNGSSPFPFHHFARLGYAVAKDVSTSLLISDAIAPHDLAESRPILVLPSNPLTPPPPSEGGLLKS